MSKWAYRAFAVVLLALATSLSGLAATLTFDYTFTGTEVTGSERLFRDGNDSSSTTPKAFPGTLLGGTYYFTTFSFDALPGSVVTVTPTVQDVESFLSLYSGSFSVASLATGYLDDQGSSLVTSWFASIVPADGHLILVANTRQDEVAGVHVAATIDYTPASVPEPATLGLVGAALAGLLWTRRRAQR
jgi:hypothetical protein